MPSETMERHPVEQPETKVNQSQQTVQGNQTNVAGDYHIVSVKADQPRTSAFLYGFLFAVLALVAIVIIFMTGRSNQVRQLALATAQPIQATITRLDIITATIAVVPSELMQSQEYSSTQATHINTTGQDCLAQYAASFPADNLVVFEEGVRNLEIKRNTEDVLLLRLTKEQQPIGLVHLQLFPAEKNFKIEKILDTQCAKVQPAGNDSIINWEAFEFNLQSSRYAIRLGYYDETSIRSGGLRRMD